MDFIVYSVRDRLVGFGALMPDTSPDNAKRNFAIAMRDNIAHADYDLYALGTYNTKSGSIVPYAVPELVMTGVDAYRVYKKEGE